MGIKQLIKLLSFVNICILTMFLFINRTNSVFAHQTLPIDEEPLEKEVVEVNEYDYEVITTEEVVEPIAEKTLSVPAEFAKRNLCEINNSGIYVNCASRTQSEIKGANRNTESLHPSNYFNSIGLCQIGNSNVYRSCD